MTTYNYTTLTDRAEILCADYMECVRNIELYTTDMISGHNPDSIILLSVARQRRDDCLNQLKLIESIAIDILSDREYARYVRYVSVMLSPLNT